MKKSIFWAVVLYFVTGSAFFTGCDESDDTDDGEGTLKVAIWGEEFIETGIPAEEFDDGYSITYHKFLVNLGDVAVMQKDDDPDEDEKLEFSGMKVWDVTKKGPSYIGEGIVEAGDYFHTKYKIVTADSTSTAGNVSAADVKLMADNGYAMYVDAEASDGTTAKSFKWGFKNNTLYDPCNSTETVVDKGEATVQVTIHGDHLFYNSAISEEPALMFTEIANADANNDGEITEAELEVYDIKGLPDYQVPDDDIDNMWKYISHMATTTGHIDGEHGCTLIPLQ